MYEDIKWLALYHAKDNTDERIVKLGVLQDRESHLIWIYFDFDLEADSCSVSENEAIKKIEKRWGYMNTFKWI